MVVPNGIIPNHPPSGVLIGTKLSRCFLSRFYYFLKKFIICACISYLCMVMTKHHDQGKLYLKKKSHNLRLMIPED